MPRKSITLAEFIGRAIDVHGPERYGYSDIDHYTNRNTKVNIKCLKCGLIFSQRPGAHLNGQGCPKCGLEKCNSSQRMTIDEFNLKAREVHGDKYGYSLVVLGKNNQVKVKIICSKHGIFEQQPNNHIYSGHDCPKCSKVYTPTSEEFIERCKEVHGNDLDFSQCYFVKMNRKVKVTCNICGNIFTPTANSLVNVGCGCLLCAIKKNADKQRKTLEQFIIESKLVHGDRYNYILVNYVNINTDIKIICKIHGEFNQRPIVHLNGCGCPECALYAQIGEYNFTILNRHPEKANGPGIVYLKLGQTDEGFEFFKLGINKGNKARYIASKHCNFQTLIEFKTTLIKALEIEQDLKHNKLKFFSIDPGLRFGGWTECFKNNPTVLNTIYTELGAKSCQI